MTDLPFSRPAFFLPDLLMTLLLRIAALACLWYGVRLWADLIGYTAHGALRFDLLATDLKAADATLAVLYPVAAIGLWLRGTWGPVIWTAAAAIEITMHEIFIDTFGGDPLKLMSIFVTAFAYLIMRLAILFLRPAKSSPSNG